MKQKDFLREMVKAQKKGRARGAFSSCTANRLAIEAALQQQKKTGSFALIESTSNQVDQFGGYTGMRPADFAAFVYGIADEMKFPRARVVLGGDHLGPNAWRGEGEPSAMDKARVLVYEYVKAGFTKIHLDASMKLASDPDGPLSGETVALRAAEMCKICEDTYRENKKPGAGAPLYVIGSEVPTPGGAKGGGEELSVTRPADARETIALAKKAFLKLGLEDARERVIAVVVQPGVEFGDADVHEYDGRKARGLSKLIEKYDKLVYECHSTDYQPRAALRALVEDHFCILKVGPALTFAMREALFALADIEEEMLGGSGVETSRLKERLEAVMLADQSHWAKYYVGDEIDKRLARKFSLSDRSRYYWAKPEMEKAVNALFANLSAKPIPLTLLSQYMPVQAAKAALGALKPSPALLVRDRIMAVTEDYAFAAGEM